MPRSFRMPREARPALVALLGLTLLEAGCQHPERLERERPSSHPLRLFDGGTLDLQTLKGQVVVVRFLGSW